MPSSSNPLILPDQSRLFTLDRDCTYLNCAYFSPLLAASEKAGMAGMRRKSEPWRQDVDFFFEECETMRELAGKLVGSDKEHIAIVPSASYGLSVAANNIKPHLKAGDYILVLAEEFPSNYYVWEELCKQTGAALRVVQRPANDDWTSAIISQIDATVKALALPNCHWTDGTLVNLVEIRKALGAPNPGKPPFLVLDVTQSLGAYPFEIAKVQPDFLACATYKWALCPYGMGMLYVADHFLNGQPIEYNWVNRFRSENLARLVDYCEQYQPGARRFDVGERSNPILLPMAAASFRQMLDWGVERIHATITQMTDHLVERATKELPVTVAAKQFRAGHMVGLHIDKRWPDDLRAEVVAAKIYVSYRGTGMRVSPHLYNTKQDIDKLVDFLRDRL